MHEFILKVKKKRLPFTPSIDPNITIRLTFFLAMIA